MSIYKPSKKCWALMLLSVALGLYAIFSKAAPNKPIPGKPSHHMKGGFQNPYLPPELTPVIGRYLWMRLTDSLPYADWEGKAGQVPQMALNPNTLKKTNPDTPTVTWLGHSTFFIQYKGINLITDPIFSERCSPVSWAGPKRIIPPAIDIHALPPVDYVVISHSHYDHLDKHSVKHLPGEPTFIVPLGLKDWLINEDIKASSVIELDWWDGTTQKNDQLWIQATPSQHFSGRTPWDFNETLWASYRINLHDISLWFAGDTGYNPHQFKQIGEYLGPVDLALIPIGAYSPRWFMKPQHINPEEAVQIALDVKARQSIGMHWGTFQLSAEDVLDPVIELKAAKKKRAVAEEAFITLAIGEQIEVKGRHQNAAHSSAPLSQ